MFLAMGTLTCLDQRECTARHVHIAVDSLCLPPRLTGAVFLEVALTDTTTNHTGAAPLVKHAPVLEPML